MRKAMAEADVGDDYYRDDPTVRRLEERAAELLGKEASLLVFSATMGNLVSLLSWAGRGESVLADAQAHIVINEGGNLAGVGGITVRTLDGERGFPTPQQVEAGVFPSKVLHPPTRVLCLENTHNAAGGRCLGAAAMDALCDAAERLSLKVHVDGARLFNAAAALGIPAARLVARASSTTICLTKGLGCPVGAIVAGSADFVAQARHWRHHVGGGMRQAGVFAAAGLVGLNEMIDRLPEDHENSKLLATLLAEAGLPVDPASVETNMVFFSIDDIALDLNAFTERVAAKGVLMSPPKGRRFRLVTHAAVDREAVRRAAEAIGASYRGVAAAGA